MAYNNGGSAPLFSVCVPVLNGAQFLDETLRSVLNQTCRDFELIVLDNQSSDKSWEIARSFADQDPRIWIFRNPLVLPMGANWEKCLHYARGRFVGMLSADDLYWPNFLQEAQRVLDQEGWRVFSANHRLRKNGKERPRRVWARPGGRSHYLAEILRMNPFSINFSMFERNLLLETVRRDGRLFRDLLTCDYDLWIRLAVREPLYYTSQPLGVYRVHGANLSTDKMRMYRETLRALDFNSDAIRTHAPWTGRFTRLRVRVRQAVVLVMETLWKGRFRRAV